MWLFMIRQTSDHKWSRINIIYTSVGGTMRLEINLYDGLITIASSIVGTTTRPILCGSKTGRTIPVDFVLTRGPR